MASEELFYATIRDIGARFRRRALSPVELTRAHLDRIEQLDPKLHAFVTVTADRALADARAAEAALGRGDISSPLLGIPIGYKDIYATRGILTTGGSALLADWIPDEDSTCVTRLQRAGAVMLGKLITHEFAFGIQFPGHRFPAARNPWDLERMPGGSSSGSGAALAAGMAFGALGTDTGGSIRGPASLCGIAGLKPTYGRCSRAGVLTLSWTLDHTGPMARTVEDCAYLLQALAGYDAADPASSREPVPDYVAPLGRGVRGLRVGVPREYFFEDVDPEVEKGFEQALATLRQLGASVEDVQIPSIQSAGAFMAIMLSEAFAYHERDLREHPERFGELLRERMQAGALITGSEYVQAQRLRTRLQADMSAVLRRVDVLGTPTSPKPAPTFATVYDPDYGFPRGNTGPFNMTGLPALAVPCGFTAAGLPISIQIVGRPFDETTVLRVGHTYEQATDWHKRHPSV
ncbi:MAG: Asp-tRNA(Asn)/Glu-tRNA(Gln) amidotransferase GatCAB subunit A [Candidatus Rokuibacteriota bacterium]|nr:MAG: Asp-tRNA(Asn)/Glu-tRNA(Gln) amidotransferase GatCAB subunit A [Candidatus Rokubacteria bacterium]